MAKVQSRRSISIRGVSYSHLRDLCARLVPQVSMSDFVETSLAERCERLKVAPPATTHVAPRLAAGTASELERLSRIIVESALACCIAGTDTDAWDVANGRLWAAVELYGKAVKASAPPPARVARAAKVAAAPPSRAPHAPAAPPPRAVVPRPPVHVGLAAVATPIPARPPKPAVAKVAPLPAKSAPVATRKPTPASVYASTPRQSGGPVAVKNGKAVAW